MCIRDRVKIEMTNHPLPRTNQQLQINNTISGSFAGYIFSIALAFKFASIISFIVKERVDRSKYQQLVSGMSINAYWASNLVYDFIIYMIVAILAIVIAKVLEVGSLTDGDAFGALWLLFIFYGLSYISFTYIVGFYYRDYGTAQASYYFITLVVGGLLPILTLLLRIISDSSNGVGRGLAWILRLHPAFCFGEGLINIGSRNLYGIRENNSVALSVFHLEVALAPILFLVVGSLLFFLLLLAIESCMKKESCARCCSGGEVDV